MIQLYIVEKKQGERAVGDVGGLRRGKGATKIDSCIGST
jgi:hypothetical protein